MDKAELLEQVGLLAQSISGFWDTIVGRVVGAIDRNTLEVVRRNDIGQERLAFLKEHEARQAKEDLEFRLLYEARTREFQNIAMRLGEMVEKQYHTVR